MAKINEPAASPKGPIHEQPSYPGPGGGLFAFTIDASTGQITRLEKVDSAGARRQLSEQDRASLQASLQANKSRQTLEAIVEQAFEAGVDCVLGSEDEKGEPQESDDEAEVRRALLLPLMERSRTMTLLQGSVLGQAILATALQQVTAPHVSEAEGGPVQQKSGAAGRPHEPGSGRPAQH